MTVTQTHFLLSKAGSIPQAGLCFSGLHVTLKLSSGGREWGVLSSRCRPPVEPHCGEMEVPHPREHFSFSRSSILLTPVPTDFPLAPTHADLKFRFLLLAIGFQIDPAPKKSSLGLAVYTGNLDQHWATLASQLLLLYSLAFWEGNRQSLFFNLVRSFITNCS